MPLENVIRGADPYLEAMKDLEAKPVPKDLECRKCGSIMKIAWHAPSNPKSKRGHVMCCDNCHITCQAIGDKAWDWIE